MAQGFKDLRYGRIAGGELGFVLEMGASEVIKAQSGRFVSPDTASTPNRGEIAVAGDTELLGWIELAEQTCSSTEGGTSGWCINDLTAVFRVPVNTGTFTRIMKGKVCDLAVTSDIQGVDLTASGEDVVWIMDGDLVNNYWVDVRLNPLKMCATGVV